MLPVLFQKHYGLGQYVFDLPVSTEVSVKGGKGIWGMPKHQANLDFRVGRQTVSSQYDHDGKLAMRIDIDRPAKAWLPLRAGGTNYCAFRGMLMKSLHLLPGQARIPLGRRASARLTPRATTRACSAEGAGHLRPQPLFAGFFPTASGVLDDHFECWFLS